MQPDLFGHQCLIHEWGRIGRSILWGNYIRPRGKAAGSGRELDETRFVLYGSNQVRSYPLSLLVSMTHWLPDASISKLYRSMLAPPVSIHQLYACATLFHNCSFPLISTSHLPCRSNW